MSGLCVSEYSFGDTLSRDETKELHNLYSAANMKQFHYMNAATLELSKVSWLYSYHTAIVGTCYNNKTEHAYIFVQPFIWDRDYFKNSCTTNRQTNRWLRERGFCVTVQGLRTVYQNARRGYASYPLTMNDGTLVVPRFNLSQMTLDAYGNIDKKQHCESVPHLAYNDDAKALIVVGKTIQKGNTYGLVRY